MRKKSHLYQSVHLTEGCGASQYRDAVIWLVSLPFHLLRALFYPPLPTLLEVANEDLKLAQQEVKDAQRALLALRYKTEALQSKVEMGRKRIRRLEIDIEHLTTHGDLDAVPTLHPLPTQAPIPARAK